MFIGRFEHSIDAKGRLALPAALAAKLAEGVYVTVGFDGCLYIFPKAEFEKMSAESSDYSLTEEKARKLWRMLFANAHEATPDSQRRIVLQAWQRQAVGIENKAVIVGVNRYIEVWTPSRWEQQRATMDEELTDGDFFSAFKL